MKTKSVGIHWFRRDLRIGGNPALSENYQKSEGRILGLFCFDRKFLNREDFSVSRFQFFLHTLQSLSDELKAMGGDLLFVDQQPYQAIPEILQELSKQKYTLSYLSWNRDYETFARERDQRMVNLISKNGLQYIERRDHLLIEPHEISKSEQAMEPYQIYTPFAKKWLARAKGDTFKSRLNWGTRGNDYLSGVGRDRVCFNSVWKDVVSKAWFQKHQFTLQEVIQKNKEKCRINIPEAGSAAVRRALEKFKDRVESYDGQRDFPALPGTSHFSVFLKNGSLTTGMICQFLKLDIYDAKPVTSKQKFLSELIWREFYYHILYHHPRVEREAFQIKYRDLKWQNDSSLFEKWKSGQTGFPIVDAGMRQLKTTGWMHNRVRMIVASFLTKDLLIDWRWGEAYFMKALLDGDLAPNNGGWQWAASTGCDAQPYFRIFNPWSQSKKFDVDGAYIKRYLPELASMPAKELHAPILNHKHYPAPCVDHAEQRQRALEMYKSV